ncbi:MAG TPA: AMP-binding protein, partial [Crinalium sp.]
MVRAAAPNPQAGKSDRPSQRNLDAELSRLQSIPEMWKWVAQREDVSHHLALHDPHARPAIKITYADLYQNMQQFAAGLQALGVAESDRVALFADNSPRWLIADQGIMMAGAIDAVRGAQAERGELLFILSDSGSTALVVENQALLKTLLPELTTLPIQLIVLLTDETPDAIDGIKLLNFTQLLELGAQHDLKPATPGRDTLATLMYTSGTSGTPKGVMLSHGNLLSQITGARAVVQLNPGEKVLSILPIWHCYERTFEYFIFAQGCTQIYTNIRHVKKDLKEFQPSYMVAVPRLWESI